MNEVLVNRVDQSGLITFNLENYYPSHAIKVFDIKDYLFHGLILKEKDFRDALKAHDWQQYRDTVLCVYCSTDAIIPVWAYMLVATHAAPYTIEIFTGSQEEYLKNYYKQCIAELDIKDFEDKKIVIKGCSDKPVPASAYAAITSRLAGYAQSIMYGEPCSTVPVYKKPKSL
jgi:hypothetical protein